MPNRCQCYNEQVECLRRNNLKWMNIQIDLDIARAVGKYNGVDRNVFELTLNLLSLAPHIALAHKISQVFTRQNIVPAIRDPA